MDEGMASSCFRCYGLRFRSWRVYGMTNLSDRKMKEGGRRTSDRNSGRGNRG